MKREFQLGALIILIGYILIAVIVVQAVQLAYSEECQDVKGTLKWGSTSHGDNNPSTSKFKSMVFGKSTICEVAKCYDLMECKGVIKEDDWKQFKVTFVYEGASEDQQDCLDYRFKLPNDGEKQLQAYEILDCGVLRY